MTDLPIQEVPIDKLELWDGNYRQGDIDAIIASIQTNGWYGTIIAHKKTRRVLAGNHRLQAAQQIGMTSVPVYWVNGNEEKLRRILIADNRTSDLATNDDQLLATLLDEIAQTNLGLIGTGYNDRDLKRMLATIDASSETPIYDPKPTVPEAAQKRWKTATGQIWTAGQQTLIIGDATEPQTYDLIDHGECDMVFTDPPYGVAYQGGTDDNLTIENDDLTESALATLLDESIELAYQHCRDGAAFYVCSPAGPNERIFASILNSFGIHRQTIIWNKDLFVLSRSDYHGQHESILYGWKPGAAHQYNGGRKQATIWETAIADWQRADITKVNKQLLEQLLEAAGDTTIWQHDRPKANREHPTMKPVELIARAIRNSTSPGETILDPFVGSGSTLLAAHQTGRAGIGIELDPAYAAVTLDRLATLDLNPTLQDG